MSERDENERRRMALEAIFLVALAAQDEAMGVEMDLAGWIARDDEARRLAAVAEEALAKVLRARALAAKVNLASVSPAGRA
jgi:hypothetical protein